MAYSPGDLSSLLLNGSNEPPRTRTLGGGMALFRIVGGGSAREEQAEGSPFILRSSTTVLEHPPTAGRKKKRRRSRVETEDDDNRDDEEKIGGGAATTNAEGCEDNPESRIVLPAQISKKRRNRLNTKEETEGNEDELMGGRAAGATNAEGEDKGSSNLKLLHHLGNSSRSTRDSEKEECTIFVGNLPLGIKSKRIEAYFKSYGQVESVRQRSLAIKGTKVGNGGDQVMVRRVCAMKGITDESVKDSANAYVVFHDKNEAKAAMAANGMLYEGHHLRVDYCMPTIDPKLSVFVGNLPFSTSEESLWEHFSDGIKNCGHGGGGVRGVRVIRDKESQLGKGFAYVLLADQKSVYSALQLHDKPFNKRKLRVLVCGKRFKDKRGSSSKKKTLGHSRNNNNQGEIRSSFEGRRGATSGLLGAQRRISGNEKRIWRLAAQEGGGRRQFTAGKGLRKQKKLKKRRKV